MDFLRIAEMVVQKADKMPTLIRQGKKYKSREVILELYTSLDHRLRTTDSSGHHFTEKVVQWRGHRSLEDIVTAEIVDASKYIMGYKKYIS